MFDPGWRLARHRRGVGSSGAYVVKVGEDCFVDAEDFAHATWTRYINHGGGGSSNLSIRTSMDASTKQPRVRFVVERDIAPGDELLFDYGGHYFEEGDAVV